MTIKITDLIAPTLQASDSSIEFKSQWAIWKALSKDSWDHIDAWWEIYRPGYKEAGKKPWDLKHYGIGGSSTSDSCSFLRDDPRASWKIYPIGPWQIGRVNLWLKGKTDKDKDASGWYYSQDLVIRRPTQPEVEIVIEQGDQDWNEGGYWAANDMVVNVAKGKYDLAYMNDECDNYDTIVKITKSSNTSPSMVIKDWKSYTDDEVSIPIDSGNIDKGLKYEEWVQIEVEAYSRGCAGDGGHTIYRYILAWPSTPQITEVAIDNANNIVLVSVDTKKTYYHPVDTVKLQRLKDSECETAAAAALQDGWADVPGMTDAGNCKGLSDNLIDARPTKGKRTWYRLVAQYHEYTTYSNPVDLGIYQPAIEAQAGAVTIMDAMSGDDGESVIVDIAWDGDTFLNVTDPSEIAKYVGTTQITWGSSEYVWYATSGLNEFDIDWEDDECRYEEYEHSARVYIGGLNEGEDIFIRCRRVLTSDDETVNGAWSEIVSVKPVTAPSWVELLAPSYIARGDALALSWTYGSDATQVGWSIVDADGKMWGHGDDANSYHIIEPDDLVDVSELELYVNVSTGGEWKRSDAPAIVRIAEAPTCAISLTDTVSSLPVAIEGESTGSLITYYLVSRGVTYQDPKGQMVQYANDIVWSAQARPGAIEITDAPLMNGCTYDLRAQAIDADTGLVSAEVSQTITIEWERRAPMPDATIEVDDQALSAVIATIKTDEMIDGDTYEVYRMTKDGVYLIAEGVEPGSLVIDRFAPFSSDGNAYRVATRTADGDCMWDDFSYDLDHSDIRLDWEDTFVEFSYDLDIAESIEKSFESRAHLDGSINGYWDKAVAHKAQFTTNIIRFESLEVQRLLRDVARYTGAVFVRTPNGLAFDANVAVDSIEESCTEGAIGVSLSIEEIDLTADHRCVMDDIVAPSEPEEEVEHV